VLWATNSDGIGGSGNGIDTHGMTIKGDMGPLYWSGNQGIFGIQEGAIPPGAQLTLQDVYNWPPTA